MGPSERTRAVEVAVVTPDERAREITAAEARGAARERENTTTLTPRQHIAFEQPCARARDTTDARYFAQMRHDGRTITSIVTVNK